MYSNEWSYLPETFSKEKSSGDVLRQLFPIDLQRLAKNSFYRFKPCMKNCTESPIIYAGSLIEYGLNLFSTDFKKVPLLFNIRHSID